MATTDNTQTQATLSASGFSPTDYDQVQTLTRTVKESHHGHKVDFQVDSKADDVLSGSFDDRVKSIVNGAIQEREERENFRANKRNFNRMLTLFGALAIGLVVTFVLTTPGIIPANWKFTIVLDSGLALYGYIKKY
jgi:hypothetical protein